MLITLSPAKTLDFDKQTLTRKHTTPIFLDDSSELVESLRGYSPKRLATLMGMSDKLAALNHERFSSWSLPFTTANAKQAVLTFNGLAYEGLDADSYSAADFTTAQKSLRILSGLYGILRPLDLIQPYRLEMGTKLKNSRGKNLYEFWGTSITEALNKDLARSKNPVLVNLASVEYFKS
ncbi:MAG: peroxide stress protein YaaA, partial [Pirellulaceae bacterium]|nr:peroxide stress protein YaaA [Pirellulaceae bacterium]